MASKLNFSSLKSGRVLVESIGTAGLRVDLSADADERAELARLNGVPAVHAVEATLLLRSEPRGGVQVRGEVRGSLTQTCVASLEVFEGNVAQQVDVRFLPADELEIHRAARAKRLSEQGDVDEDQEDEPDPIVNGRIDLGGLVAEIFTLGIELYPRKPGVAFEAPAAPAPEPAASPFAALQALKDDKT